MDTNMHTHTHKAQPHSECQVRERLLASELRISAVHTILAAISSLMPHAQPPHNTHAWHILRTYTVRSEHTATDWLMPRMGPGEQAHEKNIRLVATSCVTVNLPIRLKGSADRVALCNVDSPSSMAYRPRM